MTKNIIEMDTYILAEWLHDTYEELSKEKGWKTEKKTQVKFDDLPKKNKEVMFDLAQIILTNLVVSEVFKKNSKNKIYALIDKMFEDNNLEFICQADGEDIGRFVGSYKKKIGRILKDEN